MNAPSKEEQRRAGVVGQNVLRLRQAKGWSQTELAKTAGLSRGAVANLEIGVSRSPDEETVEKLAKALGTTASALWAPPSAAAVAPPALASVSGPADTITFETFIQRHPYDVTEREKGLLDDFRNRPGAALTGTEQDWLALLDWIRRNYAPRG
jgi:transcriptional regulator with XRE-family HTH domain